MQASIKKVIKRLLLKLTKMPIPLTLCRDGYSLPEMVKVLSPEDYQDGKVFCNLNFDDQCPVNSDNLGHDFGGNPTIINGLINFPQNIELDWEFEKILSEIDRLYNLRALISIKGHFVDKEFCNCLSLNNLKKLTKIVSYIRNTYKDSIEFITFADMAKRLLAYSIL